MPARDTRLCFKLAQCNMETQQVANKRRTLVEGGLDDGKEAVVRQLLVGQHKLAPGQS